MPMKAETIALVLLLEIVCGLGYNALIAWAHEHRLWHVSISVAVGVMGTLLIPSLAWFNVQMHLWQAGILLAACFTASGIPMMAGSLRRKTAERDQKKRRPLGNAAIRIRDEAVMELSAIAHEIAEQVREDRLTIRDLPALINRLHGLIGMLKSV